MGACEREEEGNANSACVELTVDEILEALEEGKKMTVKRRGKSV
jgi:hypothetical protein